MTVAEMFAALSTTGRVEDCIKLARSYSARGELRESIEWMQRAATQLAHVQALIEEELRESWRLWIAAQEVSRGA